MFEASRFKVILLSRLSFFLALSGLLVTWMLSLGHALHLSLPCGNHSGCEMIALSPASRFLGVPVAYIGFGAYLVFAMMAVHRLRTGSAKWLGVGYVLSIIGTLTSMGFTYFSVRILEAKCLWCIASNVIMALITLTYGFLDRDSYEAKCNWRGEKRIVCLMTALLLVSMGLGSAKMVYDANRPRWDIATFQQILPKEFVSNDSICFGFEDSVTTIVPFIDMRCPHCHKLILKLSDEAEKDKFKVIMRHFPLESHKGAFELAVIAEIVAQTANGHEFIRTAFQNKYHKINDYLQLAQQYGVEIDNPTDNVEALKRVERDLALAKKLKLEHTPTIVIVEKNRDPKIMTYAQFERNY